MINAYLQLLSWIISFIIGIIYGFISSIYFDLLKKRSFFIKLVCDILFVITISTVLSVLYFKVNYGFIHYSYIIFWFFGYYVNFKVKFKVKRHKK